MKLFTKILFFIFLFLTVQLFATGNVSVKASIDRDTATLGERLTYTITVNGLANISAPKVPKVEGLTFSFPIVYQSISIVNGKSVSKSSFQYGVTASNIAEYEIPSFNFRLKGRDHHIPPIKFKVIKNIQRSAREDTVKSNPKKIIQAPLVFVENMVDKRVVYPNEPISMTFKFFRRVNLGSQPKYSPAETRGFLRLDDDENKEFLAERDDQKYYVISQKSILYPATSGIKIISPAIIQAAIAEPSGNNDFWSSGFFAKYKKVTLETKKIQIKVKSLPQGAPQGFTGAVAKDLRMKVKLNPTRGFKQGEPITIEVNLHGEGNIHALLAPELSDFVNFKQYDTVDNIGDGKNFRFILVPKIAGRLHLPALKFSYFDYGKKKYITLTKKLDLIQVRKAEQSATNTAIEKSEFKVLAEDIRFIKEEAKLKYQKDYFKFYLIFPLGIYIFFILLKLFNHFFLHKQDDINRLKSLGIALKKLKKTQVFDVLQVYLKSKLLIQENAISLSQVKAMVPGNIYNEIEVTWNELEYFRFSSHKLTEDERRNIAMDLERKLKKWDSIL
ncbi:MAG: protein BatD [bacterium]|nr:protein BatD [bacterium]